MARAIAGPTCWARLRAGGRTGRARDRPCHCSRDLDLRPAQADLVAMEELDIAGHEPLAVQEQTVAARVHEDRAAALEAQLDLEAGDRERDRAALASDEGDGAAVEPAIDPQGQ